MPWHICHSVKFILLHQAIIYTNQYRFMAGRIHLFYFSDHYISLHWRHNDHGSVSNHQPHGCLLNRLFRRRSNKTSKLSVTGLWVGISPGPVNSPHKGPVSRKMFPFDDVIMMFASEKTCLEVWYLSRSEWVNKVLMISLFVYSII